MNTTEQITKQWSGEYEHDGNRITSPGKFEGEPIFAPYFWDLALNGGADRENGEIFTFRFSFSTTDVDIPFKTELLNWLGQKRTLNLSEDTQGFVHCF